MNEQTMRRFVRVLGCLLLLAAAGCGAPAVQTQPTYLEQHGIQYWLVTRQSPRPLRIHQLKIDLSNPRIAVSTVLSADPDGPGPATGRLTPPAFLAAQGPTVSMVNANPWEAVPDAAGKRDTNWHEGQPVRILGLAVAAGAVRGQPAEGHCGFWIDRRGRAGMGTPPDLSQVREGVAGFACLVRDGQIAVPVGGPIHPRTALGLDAARRWLYLVVVDGRQSGYSEGMSNDELAEYMRSLGCRDAMNLDGGGSSIMLLAPDGRTLRVVNDPSTKVDGKSVARPIPVALMIRATDKPPSRP